MIKKLFSSAAVACVALGGLTAVPASAQSYYSRDNYDQSRLAPLDFTDSAQNAVLIGGPGTGKTHLATAIGVAGIAAKGKRVRFIPRWIWSMNWRKKSAKARLGGLRWRWR